MYFSDVIRKICDVQSEKMGSALPKKIESEGRFFHEDTCPPRGYQL